MLFDVPVHELCAGEKSLLQQSRNRSGASQSSSAHLDCKLQLRRGGRHLLLGKNGCGKTTLLRTIKEGLPGAPKDVKTFLVDQELSLLNPDHTALLAVLSADTSRCALQNRRLELESLLEVLVDQTAFEETSLQLTAIYEELARGKDEAVEERRAKLILSGLGFPSAFLEKRICELSGGWKMRTAIAAALFVEPDLLLLDEPTNHLDIQAILWLQSYLVQHYNGSKTLLCVSHDRSFINAVLTDIVVFQGKSLMSYRGSFEEYEAAAEQMTKHLAREAEVLEKKRVNAAAALKQHVEREQRSMKNKASNIAHRRYGDAQALFYGSAQSSMVTALHRKQERIGMEKTLDGKKFKASEHGFRMGSLDDGEGETTGRALAAAPLLQKSDPTIRFHFDAVSYLGLDDDTPIVKMQDLCFCYPDRLVPTLTDVDFSVYAKSRSAIVGANGAGKTTLISLLTGRLQPTKGHVWRHRNLKIAYLDQHEADLLKDLTCTPLAHLQEHFPTKPESEVRAVLGSFGVQGSMMNQALTSLSGGQRVRVALAKICADKPHLLVLDEPTNHLDIYSVDAMTDALRSFGGAVVLVTHNQSLLAHLTEQVLHVRNGSCMSISLNAGCREDWLLQLLSSEVSAGESDLALALPSVSKGMRKKEENEECGDRARRAEKHTAPCKDCITTPVTKHGAVIADQTEKPLSVTEKEFLRCAKKVREMLQLESLKLNGRLAKTQEEKLQKENAAIEELADALAYLPTVSNLREKNKDLISLLNTVRIPTVQGTSPLEPDTVDEDAVLQPCSGESGLRGNPPGSGNRQTRRRAHQRSRQR